MAPRYTSRAVTVLETTIPCIACGHHMTVSIAEPGHVFCDHRGCARFGVMVKEER